MMVDWRVDELVDWKVAKMAGQRVGLRAVALVVRTVRQLVD